MIQSPDSLFALVGARSKLKQADSVISHTIAFLPYWGRDQNGWVVAGGLDQV